MNHLTSALERQLTSQALRKDGPLIDVTLHARCEDDTACRPIHGKALIDTGADRTAVELSELDGAKSTGVYHAQGVTSESVALPVYSMRMGFPGSSLGDVHLDRVAGTPHLKPQGLVALLGRDVLENAQLTYDGPSGSYVLRSAEGEHHVEAVASKAPRIAGAAALVLGAVGAWLLLDDMRSSSVTGQPRRDVNVWLHEVQFSVRTVPMWCERLDT